MKIIVPSTTEPPHRPDLPDSFGEVRARKRRDGTFTVEVPDGTWLSVPAWRIHAVCDIAGLTDQIEALLETLPMPDRAIAMRAWNGNHIDRYSRFIVDLGPALDLTTDEIDALFQQAAALDA